MRRKLAVVAATAVAAVGLVWIATAPAITKPVKLTLMAPNTDEERIDWT